MPPPSSEPTLRILYVEDNAHVRASIEILLQADGREIVCCESAEPALEVLAERPFDVLITDVSLPKMSGTELARRVIERSPATWVVFTSGYVLAHGLEKFGPRVRSLPKPFDPDQMDALLAEIRQSLSAGPGDASA